MRKITSLATLFLCLFVTAQAASAEEEHGAIVAFKGFVAAAKARDGAVRHFISPNDWAVLVKSGKKDELIPKMIAAAEKDGAQFSFRETEGSNFFLTGEIRIEPDGVVVPVQRGGDPWTLDVNTLVGEVEVTEDEKKTFRLIGRFVMNLNSYKQSAGSYPTTDQGLQALAVKPTTDPVPRRWFRLQSEIAKDPWGNDFVYEATEGGFTLRSLGPDGEESEDDLVSPF